MIQHLLTTYAPMLEMLAQTWLQAGAAQVTLQADGQALACWPELAPSNLEQIRAPIDVDGRMAVELVVSGEASQAAQQRLLAEARLLSTLLSSERELDQMTAELVSTRDQLLALYELTQATRRQLSLEQLLTSLLTRINQLLQTERAFVILEPPGQEPILYQYPTQSISRHLLRYYLKAVQEQRHPQILHSHQSKSGAPTWENMLLLPIVIQEQIVGGIGLIDKKGGPFTAPDLKLGSAIAEQTAAHVENYLLYQKQVVQTRMETEMELAQHVHASLLPHQIPHVAGLDVWAGCRTASQVGGDFYDFISHPDDMLTMVVGDISGKGMPAAMLMTMTRTVLRSQVNHIPVLTPQDVIDRSNQTLYTDFNDVNMFATVFTAHYVPAHRVLTYANAGHSPIIYCPTGGRARLLEADGMPMGILPHSLSTNQQLTFSPGDVLVAATDGFSEAENEAEEHFGHERLLDVVQELAAVPGISARSLVSQLYNLVDKHSGQYARSDDQTVVVLKVTGTAAMSER